MTQADKNIEEQTTESGSLASADQCGGKQPAGIKTHTSHLAAKVGEIEKEFAHVSVILQEDTKSVASKALNLAKHPRRSAELGASLAEGMAGESLGEMLGCRPGNGVRAGRYGDRSRSGGLGR